MHGCGCGGQTGVGQILGRRDSPRICVCDFCVCLCVSVCVCVCMCVCLITAVA